MSASQRKPYDVGNGTVCASFGVDGSLLSVAAAHPQAGLVELCAAPPFPVERDGDGDAVRGHRAALTDPGNAALRVLDARGTARSGGLPGWTVDGDGWTASVEAGAEGDRPAVVQRYLLRSAGPGSLRVELRGRLDRPGYAEITPGGPVPPSLPATAVDADGPRLRLSTPLPPDPAATVDVAAPDLRVGGWVVSGDRAVLEVAWDAPATDAELLITTTMACAGRAEARPPVVAVPTGPLPGPALDRVEQAAVRYTLGCTALEVADDECCIITDHRLLPLSWTRDAYYQAALLLAHADDLPGAAGVVERHLTWLWRSSLDEQGVWRRSHLTTGAVKDTAYQVDQQLFPLLELADFRRTTGGWPGGSAAGWGDAVRAVWRDLPRDPSGLVPGEENPADDPSDLPYLLSSQLLLAYVARRLVEFDDELGLGDLRLGEDADAMLETVRATFTCPGPFGEQWAYETDGEGRHRLYHDANDVPTAVAPLWGLCAADDPTWRATMRFAFSAENPGFVAGDPGGLGSAHTPGVWPLGDAQEWAVAVATGDEERAACVAERIGRVASADGMLPETYDAGSGDWLARHWFAWPGSLVGLLNAAFLHGRGPWLEGAPAR